MNAENFNIDVDLKEKRLISKAFFFRKSNKIFVKIVWVFMICFIVNAVRDCFRNLPVIYANLFALISSKIWRQSRT